MFLLVEDIHRRAVTRNRTVTSEGQHPTNCHTPKTPAEPEPDGGAAYDRASAAESFSADTEK